MSDSPSRSEAKIVRQLENERRIQCPHGYASLQNNDGPSVYRGTCNAGYHWAELVDASGSGTFVVPPAETRE